MDEILRLIKKEEKRQRETLMMIPSENYTYPEVYKALGSVLMHKYSEGQPDKRYYQGNIYIDQIEKLAKKRALELFKLSPKIWDVNVQALSGSPANLAIYNALLEPGDKILSLYLPDGGHLSHGWYLPNRKVTLISKIYNIEFYHIDPKTGRLDYGEIQKLAVKFKPKLIVSGGTSYPREIDHKKLGQIAHKINAFYLADVSHEAGLIAGGANRSPFEHADAVMMTTHKTLRGPRGALIFSHKTRLPDGQELSSKVDSSVFPGIQGGPHNHSIAGIAIALQKAKTVSFKKYALQTVINAKKLADALRSEGLNLVTGGTDKHLILIDLTKNKINSWFIARALEEIGIIVNRNAISADGTSPKTIFYPNGIRLGTPALTTRGMKELQMEKLAKIIGKLVKHLGNREIPENIDMRKKALREFEKEIKTDKQIGRLREEVIKLTKKFPI